MKKKLIIVLMLFASLPMLVFSSFSIYSNSQELQHNASEFSLDNAQSIKSEINVVIDQNFDLLKVLAQNEIFQSGAPKVETAKTLLNASVKVHPEAVLNYTDVTGQQKVRSDNLAMTNVADRDYFKQSLQTGKPVVSEVLIAKATGNKIIVLAVPVLNESKQVTGILTNNIELSFLSDYVTKLSQNGNIPFIIDRSGKILAHVDKNYIDKDISAIDFVQQGLKGNDGTSIFVENGQKMMVSYTYNELTGWLIGNAQSYDSVMSQNTKIISQSIVLLVIVLLVSCAAGFFLSNKIARPLIQLTAFTKQASSGDLTVQVTVKDNNEIGQLADSFNLMLQNLRHMIQQVGSNSESLAASAEQLTASASQTSQATEQVAKITEEVALGTEKQVQTLKDSSQSVQDISDGIQMIAANATNVSSLALDASQKTEQGNVAIHSAITQMESMQQTVNGLALVIKELGDRSQEIGQIVGAITSIAQQTNLLALNANIEAARAGEQGRGFAVVAGEVRKLAEQSSRSAQTIAELITVIQDKTANAVESMDIGITEVNQGLHAVHTAGDAFTQIQQSIRQVSTQIQEVSDSSQQMCANALQVVQSFETIMEVSDMTASGTQNVSAAAEEQLATMEEITASATVLSGMADELQDVIGKFKV
ncbi:methyl-accepting chemotaxis protein [Paenibacillus sp. FSL H7-0331]|uniref:methyl-accepting chemotaxis protein n=1 Tax=Paenibacillus sp. FSL H7-0331 TaxID=1920421 RepID=UPI00096FB066|nr:methyl-accepting chemotaxis protein [Paenibacillus sp. FSL H7-0331]OMF20863.1 hypothetical protein BK127_02170 [Paenibacillus sp. FSL H7-0331]